MPIPKVYCPECRNYHLAVTLYRCHKAVAEERTEELNFRERGEPELQLYCRATQCGSTAWLEKLLGECGADEARVRPEPRDRAGDSKAPDRSPVGDCICAFTSGIMDHVVQCETKAEAKEFSRDRISPKPIHVDLPCTLRGAPVTRKTVDALEASQDALSSIIDDLDDKRLRSRATIERLRNRLKDGHDKLNSLGVGGRGLSERITQLVASMLPQEDWL